MAQSQLQQLLERYLKASAAFGEAQKVHAEASRAVSEAAHSMIAAQNELRDAAAALHTATPLPEG